MEGFLMKRFFRTKFPALVLSLVLMLSAVPMAGAAVVWGEGSISGCPHSSYTVIGSKEPTCQSTGWRLLRCSLCGASGAETLSTTSHTYRRYDYNTTYHWLVCSVCGAEDSSSRSQHTDSNRDGRCDTCGTSMGTTADTGDDIVYKVRPGSYVLFDEDDFYDLFRKFYPGYSLDHVIFDKPSASAFTDGTLYYDYGGRYQEILSRSSLDSYVFYYDNRDSRSYSLDDLAFVATNNFDDEVTLSFRAYDSASRYVDASVTISSTGSSISRREIAYEVQPGSYAHLDEDDFYDFFRSFYPGYSLQYVTFSTPSSSAFADGALYYDYGGRSQFLFSQSNLSGFTFSYSGSGYDLDNLTFVADRDFEDDVTLSFRAYGSNGLYVDGYVTISPAGGIAAARNRISYTVKPGSYVHLDEDDFNSLFRETYTSRTLEYVVFDRPSSSAFVDGTLYYDYGGRSQLALSQAGLSSYEFYFDNDDDRYFSLDDLTFVADSDFEDDVTLSFTAYDGSRSVSGYVTISSSASDKADITYTVRPGSYSHLDEDDFYSFFRKNSSGYSLQYVVFDTPSVSSFNNGTLYYDYGGKSEKALTRSSLGGYVFYYDNDDDRYYSLDNLTFVADRTFADDVVLTFRAHYSPSTYVNGSVRFTAGTSTTASVSGDIRYAGTSNNRIQINANDIARYFSASYPGSTLQYVTLGGVPSTGSLYYNYYGASQYGTSSRMRLTSSNYNSQVLYFSPVSTGQYALTELTYEPSGYNYCDMIPFTAYGSGSRSVSGNILISVNPTAVSEVYGVTQRGTAVTFPASAIYSAVSAATGVSLGSIQLLSLPAVSQGTVYVGTGSTRATTSTLYTYGSGTQSISQLRFVPSSSFTGSVQIPYVAYNTSGTAIATGLFSLGVLNSSRNFKDVSSSTWCYKYVVELSDAKVIDGYSDGSFKPDSTITYGAALKLIMLAAGYSEQAPVNSNVFSGYLAKAQADGIITRSDVDLTKPITRLQVAQIAAGAMKLDTSNLSSVQPFTDTTDASVRALNAAGIVEGYFSNGTSAYRPNNTLTRGQVSAIVWRMEQYNK